MGATEDAAARSVIAGQKPEGIAGWGNRTAPSRARPALLTTVVGSYPQPDWLIDRERLAERLPPRVERVNSGGYLSRSSRRPRTTRHDSPSTIWSGPASTWSQTAR